MIVGYIYFSYIFTNISINQVLDSLLMIIISNRGFYLQISLHSLVHFSKSTNIKNFELIALLLETWNMFSIILNCVSENFICGQGCLSGHNY